MAELALGIAGVVPLIVGAIKAYDKGKSKLKLFRHSSREIERMHRAFKIQRQVFKNECNIWLAFVIEDAKIASDMVHKPEHDGWNNPNLDTLLHSKLKDNYDVWSEINTDVCESIDSLEAILAKFEEVRNVKDGKLKQTLKRTLDGAKVAVNATDIEILVKKLRSSNNALTELRDQIKEIKQPKTYCSTPVRAAQKGEWASLIRIRRASKALHEALIRTWKCGQPGHLEHAVKLFVETKKVDGEVQMNLAIVCRNQTRNLVQSTLVRLEVRSQNLEWIDQPKLSGQLSMPDDHLEAPPKRLEVAGSGETTVQRHSKRERDTMTTTAEESSDYGSCDLKSSEDICKELTRRLSNDCLGHIDDQSDEPFRHSFYPAKGSVCRGALQSSSTDHRAISMDEILDDSSKAFFSTVDRLRLARSMVSAVLQFHSTPWLSDFWKLRDLAFFKTDQCQEVSEDLRTLHLGFEVAQRHLDSMDDVQTSSECSSLLEVSEDERLLRGIYNLTLHSLGVALLQIDRWTQVDPEDILNVRKMAKRASSFCPQYREITQKCLQCDFGYGSDLTKPRLQAAVYENVVSVLEKMISSLDLTED